MIRSHVTKAVLVAAATLSYACGSGASFGLSSNDNDPARLAQAMSRVEAPAPGPVNETGKPLAFLVARDKGDRALVAFDLEAKQELWRKSADVTSKIVVGKHFVAYAEGEGALVARNVTTGAELWRRDLGGKLVGTAADSQRVFVTVADDSGDKTWVLTALDGSSGKELWHADAPGALGAPAARGGLVFSPFLKQWLAILDARTGEQITRIRGIDEEISFVRTTPQRVYFGSKAGVFVLDERAASGKRAESTYGSAKLPDDLSRVHYHWDAFDPIQAGYSAYDRNRILWRGEVEGDALGFADDRVTVHTYRFFFGFDPTSGQLAWAFNHPRVDVIASAHEGPVIAFASMLGDLGALDPVTGQRVYRAKVEGQFLGGTFDADGWAPSDSTAGEGGATTLAGALASIARDRDARFAEVKKFAVTELSKIDGPDVTGDLLAIIMNENTPPFLYDKAVEVLIDRKDAAGLPKLVAALDVRYDYIDGDKPRGIGVVARAIASMKGAEVGAKLRKRATTALLAHLRAPETPAADLVHIVRALGAVGGGGEIQPLESFLLVYRADPAFSSQIDAVAATIDVLLDKGGAAQRELVAFVASDPRSQRGVAAYASRALAHGTTPEDVGAKSEADKGAAKDAPGKAEASGGKAKKPAAKAEAAAAKP